MEASQVADPAGSSVASDTPVHAQIPRPTIRKVSSEFGLKGKEQPKNEEETSRDDQTDDKDHGDEDKSKDEKRKDGKRRLKKKQCVQSLGFGYPTWKKWTILSVIFVIQVSMNFNTSVYPNAVTGISQHFHVSEQAARVGQMIFLVAYAFGSELWAPWSEEYGRWWVLQLSLGLVNIWQIPCALAPNIGTIIAGRFLGGISSAGGSVTLGIVADMWDADHQQFAVAFIVLASVGGSVIGPIVGGFIEASDLSWRWIFWIQLIFGGATQIIHLFVPETEENILIDKEAKRRRESGEDPNAYGPNELKEGGITIKGVLKIWGRPFEMFFTEPIVLCLSLLSGFSDALIFTFLESYNLVYKQWGFSTRQIALAYFPILIGYFIGYFSFFPNFLWHQRELKRKDDVQPEFRLYWLLYTAPLETIGLFIFAWTSLGPPIPWIAPMIASSLIGIANYCIYMATIDYMVAAYGPYAASATGGNALARDFLAGVAAMYATPMYTNIGHRYHLEWPSTILAILALIFTLPIYVFYYYGPSIREKSKFAQTLMHADDDDEEGVDNEKEEV